MNLKRRKEKHINTVELRDRQLITDFGWMSLAILIGVIVPGIIIWLLFGYDFSFSFEIMIGGSGVLFKILTTFLVLLITCLSAITFYYLKICKADIFLFSFAFFSVYVAFFYTGQTFKGTGGKEIIFRFLISLATGAVGTIFGTMIAWFVVNIEYKNEEALDEIIKRKETQPETLTDKEKKILKKYEMEVNKQKIQEEHNEKIIELLNNKLQVKIQEEHDMKEKLDKEEELERQKEIENKTNT